MTVATHVSECEVSYENPHPKKSVFRAVPHCLLEGSRLVFLFLSGREETRPLRRKYSENLQKGSSERF